MRKRRIIRFVLLAVALFFVVIFSVFFINLEHLTSGKLSKAEVVLRDPVSGVESVEKTFTDTEDLRKLTSVFFAKINENFFADTAEDSLLSVRFTFENKTVKFNLFYESDNGQKRYTHFKYPARGMKFTIPSSQSETLKEMLQ